jgi:CRP/FNR family transcriptional regulator, cyclic AMP receptor protein
VQDAQPERKLVGVRVLDAQPDLAEGLDPEQAALARRHAVAVLDTVPAGPWSPADAYPAAPGALGLLVIGGTLARDVRVAGRWCSELLGPGDLLRPWDPGDGGGGGTVPSDCAWTVIEEARLAVLDERFTRTVARWPELVTAFVARTLRRSRWTTIMLAVSNLTRVDDRVTALLWHLADRWGRVTRDGVLVPVPLTHEMIGRLVGAHRPSVTSALGELGRASRVTRAEGGWLLHGDPPQHAPGGNGGGHTRFSIDPTLAAALPAIAVGLFG